MIRAVNFLNLPVELICNILSFLDTPDLVRCTTLTKHIRKVISDSSRLQYAIGLAKYRMISILPPSSAPPYVSRLKILRDREKAWSSLSWNGRYNLKLPPTGSVYEFIGGFYGNGKEDERRMTASISFLELPSTLEGGGPNLKTWTHSMSDVIIIDFTMDPSQDLLVLIALAAEGSAYVYELHLRSLSTNEPHSKATLSILPCLLKPSHTHQSSEHIAAVRVQVSGALVALLIKEVHDSIGAHLEIWDWTKNPHYSCKMARISGIDDFTFLSQDAFLLVRPTGNFEVYTFQNPITASTIPICLANYGFPPLSDGYMYWYITMSSNPAPGSMPQANTKPNATRGKQQIYYPKPDERILACCLYIFNPSTDDNEQRIHCFVFFVNIHTLLHPPVEWLKKLPSRYKTGPVGPKLRQYCSSQITEADPSSASQLKALPFGISNASSPHISYPYYHLHPEHSSSAIASPVPDAHTNPPSMPFPSLPSHPTQSFSLWSPPPAGTPNDSIAIQMPAHIPWAVWGPQNTRWFEERLSTDWQHAIYGLRTVESVSTKSIPRLALSSSPWAQQRDRETPTLVQPQVPTSAHSDTGIIQAHVELNQIEQPVNSIEIGETMTLAPSLVQTTPNVAESTNTMVGPNSHKDVEQDDNGNHLGRDDTVNNDERRNMPTPWRHLRLRDYNPYSVVQRLEEERQMANDKKGKNKISWRAPRVVTEPSTTLVTGVFRYDIVSWLPYVETVSEELFDVTDVMMDDCRILLLRRGDNGRLRRVDVLTM